MNTRQKWGLGLAISGIGSLVVGIFGITTEVTPGWIDLVLRGLATTLPLLGIVVNFPANTNPK